MDIRTIPGFSRYTVSSEGIIYKSNNQPISVYNSNGYLMTGMCSDETGKRFHMLVHRAVVMAFIGPIPKGMWVNHKNGIRNDNRIDNLEIMTPSENHRHARDVLKRKYTKGGSNSGKAKLTKESIVAIRQLKKLGWSNENLAKAFQVSPPTISYVNTGRTWSHVDVEENIEIIS